MMFNRPALLCLIEISTIYKYQIPYYCFLFSTGHYFVKMSWIQCQKYGMKKRGGKNILINNKSSPKN